MKVDTKPDFGRIYREHRQGLFSLALSITRDAQRAEDAVHEAFCRLWRNQNRELPPEPDQNAEPSDRTGDRPGVGDDPVAYTFASVRNAALDAWRKQRRDRLVHMDKPIESNPGGADGYSGGGVDGLTLGDASVFADRAADDPLRQVAEAELVDHAKAAVDLLPDDQRQTVVLRLIAGLTFQQIADTMDAPLATVTSRYRRALQRVKNDLEQLVS